MLEGRSRDTVPGMTDPSATAQLRGLMPRGLIVVLSGTGLLVGVLAYRGMTMPPAIPIATYRLQLTADFNFDHAAEVYASFQKQDAAVPGDC